MEVLEPDAPLSDQVSAQTEQIVTSKPPKSGMLTVAQYKDRLKRRLYRTLDYISIAFSVLAIYAAFLVADYLLIKLIEYLAGSELSESKALSTFFKSVKVGLALLGFILCLIHGSRSAWEQYQLDSRLGREDEKPHV